MVLIVFLLSVGVILWRLLVRKKHIEETRHFIYRIRENSKPVRQFDARHPGVHLVQIGDACAQTAKAVVLNIVGLTDSFVTSEFGRPLDGRPVDRFYLCAAFNPFNRGNPISLQARGAAVSGALRYLCEVYKGRVHIHIETVSIGGAALLVALRSQRTRRLVFNRVTRIHIINPPASDKLRHYHWLIRRGAHVIGSTLRWLKWNIPRLYSVIDSRYVTNYLGVWCLLKPSLNASYDTVCPLTDLYAREMMRTPHALLDACMTLNLASGEISHAVDEIREGIRFLDELRKERHRLGCPISLTIVISSADKIVSRKDAFFDIRRNLAPLWDAVEMRRIAHHPLSVTTSWHDLGLLAPLTESLPEFSQHTDVGTVGHEEPLLEESGSDDR